MDEFKSVFFSENAWWSVFGERMLWYKIEGSFHEELKACNVRGNVVIAFDRNLMLARQDFIEAVGKMTF